MGNGGGKISHEGKLPPGDTSCAHSRPVSDFGSKSVICLSVRPSGWALRALRSLTPAGAQRFRAETGCCAITYPPMCQSSEHGRAGKPAQRVRIRRSGYRRMGHLLRLPRRAAQNGHRALQTASLQAQEHLARLLNTAGCSGPSGPRVCRFSGCSHSPVPRLPREAQTVPKREKRGAKWPINGSFAQW
jgi:hypothetical protein